MPDPAVTRKAKEDLKEGKSPSTAAGEFVHEEIEHVRQGKHGARSPQQAIAIGLSEARRAGIPLKGPKKSAKKSSSKASPEANGRSSKRAQKSSPSTESAGKRSKAALSALKAQPTDTVSTEALSRHAKSVHSHRKSK
jgi:hypothetical protein